MRQPTTVSAKKNSSSKPKGKVIGMHIRRAANAGKYLTTSEHEPETDSKGNQIYAPSQEPAAHDNWQAAMAHASDQFGETTTTPAKGKGKSNNSKVAAADKPGKGPNEPGKVDADEEDEQA